MLEYTWKILSLYASQEENGLKDIVKRVSWSYTATDGPNSAVIYRDTFFENPLLVYPDISKGELDNSLLTNFPSENFPEYIDYEKLRENKIIEWIEACTDIEALKQELNLKLEDGKKLDKVYQKKLPWDFQDKYSFHDKYIMVKDGEVILGPIFWNRDHFQNAANRYNISLNLPEDIVARQRGILPIDTPLVLNDSVKIYKVNLLNEQPEENYFTENGNIIWDFSSGVAVGTYIAVDKELDEVKKNLLQVIERKRDQKEIEGLTVTVQNNEYKLFSGPFSRLNLLEKYNLMTEEETCAWKFMENKWATLNKSELLTLYHLVMNFFSDLNTWERDRTLEIYNAETVDQLRTVLLEVQL